HLAWWPQGTYALSSVRFVSVPPANRVAARWVAARGGMGWNEGEERPRLGTDHPFGPPTGYELVHEGKRYAPKAVVGIAFRYVLGRILKPEEFSGGEAPGQANYVLRELGFTVVKKGGQAEADEDRAGKDWSAEEVRLIVADYFAMLQKE